MLGRHEQYHNATSIDEDAPVEPGEENNPALTKTAPDEWVVAAKQHILANCRDFSTFAKDSTLYFVPSPDETFSFDAESNKVRVPLEWFENGRYSGDELRWANYHELAHFIDMREDPRLSWGTLQRWRLPPNA